MSPTAALAVIVTAVVSSCASAPATLRARRIEIVDGEGRPRIVLVSLYPKLVHESCQCLVPWHDPK